MSKLKVCRVCLSQDVKMYDMNEFMLKLYYEEVMATEVIQDLPHYFCYECAALLYKFHKFRQKCQNGQETLKELQKKGPITLAVISKVDRKGKNLLSRIDNITEPEKLQSCVIVNTCEDVIKTEIEMIITDDVDTEFDKDTSVVDIKIEDEIKNEENIDDEQKPKNTDWENVENVFNDETSLLIVVEDKAKRNKKNKTKQDVAKNKRRILNIIKNTTKEYERKGGLPKRTPLDSEHWLKVSLNEKEAVENFKLRAKDPKYLKAIYKCDKCYTTFSTQDIMDRHMKLNHCESRGQHICQFCQKRFRMKCLVTQHIVVHYNKFKCLRCDLMFHSEHSASNHNVFHSGVMLPCKHCGLEFRHKSSYYSHLRIYHRSAHVCPLCGEAFVSEKGLQQHKILRHLNAEINLKENEDQNTYCERCDIKFETQIAYYEHFQQSVKHADDFEPKEEQDVVGTSDTPAPLKGGAAKTFARSNSSRPTSCPECQKLFQSYSQYTKHHRAEHEGFPVPRDVTQVCEVCGVTVKGGAIAIHMNVHTKEKIYSCPTCGAQFSYLTSFTRHQLTHTGEKPFKCPLCEKRFTQKSSMQLHHRTFHLKEPYPKRIRRKQNPAAQEMTTLEDFSGSSDG